MTCSSFGCQQQLRMTYRGIIVLSQADMETRRSQRRGSILTGFITAASAAAAAAVAAVVVVVLDVDVVFV